MFIEERNQFEIPQEKLGKQNERKIKEKEGLGQGVFDSLKVMFRISLSQIDFLKTFYLFVYYFATLGLGLCAGFPLFLLFLFFF